jgi:MULE transposase domain
MEYSIAWLWNAVKNNQLVTASSTDGGKFYYLRPACEALVDVESGTGARVQVFTSTDTLLRHVDTLDHSMSKMNLVFDSKHRVLLNNYPITVVGVLDVGQQFNMIALAVSNKEDEEVLYCLLQAVKDSLQLLELYPTFTCTMFDNSDAIQRALCRCFPSAVIGNCLFRLQQNFKQKRTLWNVQVPQTVPVNARSKWTIRRRDENESFAKDAVNWFSSLQHVHEFNLCSEIFL